MLRTVIEERSAVRIVYSDVEVKLWAKSLPSVSAARPEHCPCCGLPGAVVGSPLGLVGHGLRERTLAGPIGANGAAEQLSLRLRRYRCRGCGAVVVVAPRGVLRGMLYGAVAVAMALALWAEGMAGWRVRGRVKSGATDDDYARWHGWRSLSRWVDRAGRWWRRLRPGAGERRQRARALVTQLAARAPTPTGPVLVLACAGALAP